MTPAPLTPEDRKKPFRVLTMLRGEVDWWTYPGQFGSVKTARTRAEELLTMWTAARVQVVEQVGDLLVRRWEQKS